MTTNLTGVHNYIWEKLCTMQESELRILLLEAEKLDKTGVLPENSPLRRLTEEVFGNSVVLQMISVSYNIYKMFAIAYFTHSPSWVLDGKKGCNQKVKTSTGESE